MKHTTSLMIRFLPQDETPRKPRGKNAPAAVSSNFERGVAGQRPDPSIVSAVFELDCQDTPRLSTWYGMWHVHALASVIGQQMYVHSNYNQYLRPAFHKLIFPREYSHNRCRRPFTIVWSRATDMLNLTLQLLSGHLTTLYHASASLFNHSHNGPFLRKQKNAQNSIISAVLLPGR